MIRKILSLSMVLLLAIGVISCRKEAEVWDYIPLEEAYDNASKLEPGLMGAYYTLGTYRLLGNYAICLGDYAADLATADPSSGHFVAEYQYNITVTTGELADIWEYGYKLIDRCVRIQNGAAQSLASGECTASDSVTVLSALYQSYALRALANFYLVNIFALPYRAGGANSGDGIVIVDKEPVEAFAPVTRSSVAEVYAHIDDCIKQAKDFYGKFRAAGGKNPSAAYINEAGISAIEARVALYKGEWDRASAAADKALNGKKPISNDEYVKMWSSTAISGEDIFVIVKSEDDNLSANSINTQYGSYGGRVSSTARSLFASNDIRSGLLSKDGKTDKWAGLPSSAATSNIHVFRVSEMYLIKAEAEAQRGNVTDAQDALFEVAKRNADIASTSALPGSKDALLDFIEEERVRELYAEGHRWYDARRTGKPVLYRAVGYAWNVSGFCYPIPSGEVNAGFGVKQTADWSAALPDANTEANAVSVAVTSVALPSELILKVADTTQSLMVSVSPFYASNREVEWSTDKANVVDVDSVGNLRAEAVGTAQITVTAKDGGKTAVCAVQVKDSVHSVKLSEAAKTLTVGEKFLLGATLTPADPFDATLIWSSDSAKYAAVDGSGVVTAVAAGTAKIVVKSKDGGKTDTCVVTVTAAVPVTPATYAITIGTFANGTVTASKTADIAEGEEITLTVTPETGYQLKAGTLKAYKTGEPATEVTISAENKFTMPAHDVTVEAEFEAILVTSITVATAAPTTLAAGGTLNLAEHVTVAPADALNKTVNYSGNNDAAATVDASTGVVTGVAAGSVTITITATDGSGVSATHTITVE